ncbi:MAG: hypothetical protein ABIJ46_01180 [bacterium]
MDISDQERHASHRRAAIGLSLTLLLLLTATVAGMEAFAPDGESAQVPRTNRAARPEGNGAAEQEIRPAEPLQAALAPTGTEAVARGHVSRTLALASADDGTATGQPSDDSEPAGGGTVQEGSRPSSEVSAAETQTDTTSQTGIGSSSSGSSSGGSSGQSSGNSADTNDDIEDNGNDSADPSSSTAETDQDQDPEQSAVDSLIEALTGFWLRLWETVRDAAIGLAGWTRETFDVRVEEGSQ